MGNPIANKTADASLTGDVTLTSNHDELDMLLLVGQQSSTTATPNAIASLSVTINETKSRLVCFWRQNITKGTAVDLDIQIREGASNILATQNITGGPNTYILNSTTDDLSTGAKTITFEIIVTGGGNYQYAANNAGLAGNPRLPPPVCYAVVVDADDTHAAEAVKTNEVISG